MIKSSIKVNQLTNIGVDGSSGQSRQNGVDVGFVAIHLPVSTGEKFANHFLTLKIDFDCEERIESSDEV
jgi:hypothetical protein